MGSGQLCELSSVNRDQYQVDCLKKVKIYKYRLFATIYHNRVFPNVCFYVLLKGEGEEECHFTSNRQIEDWSISLQASSQLTRSIHLHCYCTICSLSM